MAGKAEYPADHKPGMQVPRGGSSCAKCEYLRASGKNCGNQYFIAWDGGAEKPAGSSKLPKAAIDYCSDWFEPNDAENRLMKLNGR